MRGFEAGHAETLTNGIRSDRVGPTHRPSLASEVIARRYEVLGLLGVGGMGSVYRVRDLELGEVVALKFLRADVPHDAPLHEGFRQEVRLARRVTHANVARMFDIGEHDGQRFLTMEYIDGESLGTQLAREGKLGEDRVVAIGLALCSGLAAAHAAGVVHRDLKPDNVLIERSGRVVITDFGIAHAVASGPQAPALVGTPAYMAPEQADGVADIDGRADLYALGAVLYELLTGVPAWRGDTFAALLMARLLAPPPDPRVLAPRLSPALAEVVLRCLARDREQRYASAVDVAAALQAITWVPASLLATATTLPPMAVAARAMRVAPVPGPGDRSVAVLGFRHIGPSEDAWVADQLVDELIDALSAVRRLRVRPRSVVLSVQSGLTDPRAIGRALEVEVVVEGSVHRTKDALRVTTRLINVADGFQLWARRFDRQAHDLFEVNAAIAEAIAAALVLELAAPPPRGPTASGAVEAYLLARKELRHAWAGAGDLARTVALFEEATAHAPSDPDVLAGYAMARARRLNYGGRGPGEPTATLALAQRAIDAAPHLGEPWLALATVRFVTSAWPEAVVALRAALDRAPGLVKAHEMLANLQLEVGQLDEGIYRLETVLSLDPMAIGARGDLARALALLGQWDRASMLLTLPVERPEDRFVRQVLRARFNLWRHAPVHDLSETPEGPYGPLLTYYIATVQSGTFTAEARQHFAQLLASTHPGSRVRPLLCQLLAELHAYVGADDHALAAVEQAADEALHDLSWLDHCPTLRSLQTHPRFVAARERVAARVRPVLAALA